MISRFLPSTVGLIWLVEDQRMVGRSTQSRGYCYLIIARKGVWGHLVAMAQGRRPFCKEFLSQSTPNIDRQCGSTTGAESGSPLSFGIVFFFLFCCPVPPSFFAVYYFCFFFFFQTLTGVRISPSLLWRYKIDYMHTMWRTVLFVLDAPEFSLRYLAPWYQENKKND